MQFSALHFCVTVDTILFSSEQSQLSLEERPIQMQSKAPNETELDLIQVSLTHSTEV